jgi:tetratricopeptide (TPR) repeat protein
LLTFTGRHDEAISEAKRAQELDPLLAYINTHAGITFAYSGQPDRAIEEYRTVLKINPNYFLAHFHLGKVYFEKSMFKESVAEYENAVDLSSGNSFTIASLVSGYYRIGKKDQADKLLDSLNKRSETEYVPATSFALIHRTRGEEDLALEWLKRACSEHDTFLPWIKDNPIYIPEGSRAKALLKEVGLL